MTMLTAVFVSMVALYTALAAMIDLRLHRIPNYLTVPAAALGLAFHTFSPSGFGFLLSLAGFALGFAILLLPFLMGGGGAGDVKLLAALGAWLGPQLLAIAFAGSAVLAALLAVLVMSNSVFSRGVIATRKKFVAKSGEDEPKGKRRRARVLPFAVPVALSTWILLAVLVMQGRV